jgi:23S rRNA (guanine745-N1)-methyltransferase
MLLCPVRDCHRPLLRQEKRFSCERGHVFDIARSGYVNLLQPQDRRSKHPGDSKEASLARRNLHERGVTRPLFDAIAQMLCATPRDAVLDAGCGEGFYLGSLSEATGCQAHGIDISVPAIELASRRYKDAQWIVANADRFIPFADRSFSIILSVTARRNVAEFPRVLREGGRVLIGIPAPDDLIELRGRGRDRCAPTTEEFAKQFRLLEQRRVTTAADLDAAGVEEVQLAIYRPMQRDPARAMRVTFSLDLLLFGL